MILNPLLHWPRSPHSMYSWYIADLKTLNTIPLSFFNYLRFILYQPSIAYQFEPILLCWVFNPICHGPLNIPYLPSGKEGVDVLIWPFPTISWLERVLTFKPCTEKPLQVLSVSIPGVCVWRHGLLTSAFFVQFLTKNAILLYFFNTL